MTEPDIDQRLRAAGARLRADAPSADETDTALARTLERPERRTPWRWIGPAVVVGAAAAAVLGVVVVTQDEDTLRQVPADAPVTAPATPPPSLVPGSGPGVATVPSSSPASSPPATIGPATSPPASAPTTSAAIPPGTEWVASVVEADFDGDGGACVELSAAAGGRLARGCVPGEQVRAGRPAYAVVVGDGERSVVAVTTDGVAAEAVPVTTVDPGTVCVGPIDTGDRLADVLRCESERGLYALLPAASDGDAEWWASRGGVAPALAMVPARVASAGAQAFEMTGTTAGGDELRCVVVTVDGDPGWREGCAAPGVAGPFLAGFGSTLVHVEIDAERRVTALTPIASDLAPIANGCPVGLGTILGSVPGGATTGLRCVDGAAITSYSPTLIIGAGETGGVSLHRDAGDGSWPIADAGPSLTCARYAETCADFGATAELDEAVLPMPSVALLTAPLPADLEGDPLDPMDVTTRFAGLGPAADVDALAAAIEAGWRAEGDVDSRFARVSSAGSPLVLAVTAIPDDSVGAVGLVVWYSEAGDEGGVDIDAVIQIAMCSRGVTTLDGAKVCV